jgi:hypothetical protein
MFTDNIQNIVFYMQMACLEGEVVIPSKNTGLGCETGSVFGHNVEKIDM